MADRKEVNVYVATQEDREVLSELFVRLRTNRDTIKYMVYPLHDAAPVTNPVKEQPDFPLQKDDKPGGCNIHLHTPYTHTDVVGNLQRTITFATLQQLKDFMKEEEQKDEAYKARQIGVGPSGATGPDGGGNGGVGERPV